MISPAHAVAAEAGSCKLLLDGVSDCCWMTGLRSQYFVCRIPRSACVCLGDARDLRDTVTIRESVVSPVVCVASEHGPVTHTRKLEVVRWSYGILRMPNSDNHICLPGWFLLSAVRALCKEAASCILLFGEVCQGRSRIFADWRTTDISKHTGPFSVSQLFTGSHPFCIHYLTTFTL